jgi:hypothetical protein
MTKNLEMMEEMSIDQILKRNGDSMHIKAVKDLAKFEDDPLLIFGWENVDSFVNSLNQQPPENFPAPSVLPALPINSLFGIKTIPAQGLLGLQ